ncbi:HET-domain-containing protein [Dichomitus squalens LYAD-421 SS1]|uniref:HET-domain-containing protein n=1 Tax=Dichomitus squalens (strain LYAD-421) TaxID=732165 RepID=R7SNS5_DICSQ|nr:HET-domain-containing protein [Dichomitus squalens LYAD-421 SS1]EJF57588.1 HET-domain-containing protein [Dichomitus squalens LYAD-421 SS1]
MRLLNTRTGVVKEFHNPKTIPPYAILSHVWQEAEQTLQDISNPANIDPSNPWNHVCQKITDCCVFAANEGFDWIWIDTCCIDKTSSSELSEAINSMYAWYAAADVCYVWLHDVEDTHPSDSGSFCQSVWFTRGWTLQELIAPRYVVFLSKRWHTLGTKQTLAYPISLVTGIDIAVLLQTMELHQVSVARRMSWAATRRTTREEDRAYSLMGIFDVNMPTIYGEGGPKAFFRLQVEILKQCPDQSIFAWGRVSIDYLTVVYTLVPAVIPKDLEPEDSFPRCLLAPSPAEFEHSGDISSISLDMLSDHLQDPSLVPPEYSVTAYGMRTAFPVIEVFPPGRSESVVSAAILACQDVHGDLIVLFLHQRPRHWTTATAYLLHRVGADLRTAHGPSPSTQYYRVGRLSREILRMSVILSGISVRPLYVEHTPSGVTSLLSKALPPTRSRNRVSYAFFFPAWLQEWAGISPILDDPSAVQDSDGIMLELIPGVHDHRAIIFASRAPSLSNDPCNQDRGPQGVRFSMYAHCSCESSPLQHPMSIAVDMMVPEFETERRATVSRHGRRRSLSAVLTDDKQFAQMMLNVPASPSPSEHVWLPDALEGEPSADGSPDPGDPFPEQAWQCANKRTHLPTVSNPNIRLKLVNALGKVSVKLKRWEGCRKTRATYVYIVELRMVGPTQALEPQRQGSPDLHRWGRSR